MGSADVPQWAIDALIFLVEKQADALREIVAVTSEEEDLAHGDGGYEAGQIARAALASRGDANG